MVAKQLSGLFIGVVAALCPASRAGDQSPQTISNHSVPYSLCFNGNDRLLIANSDRPGSSVVLWDLAHNKTIFAVKKRSMYSCSASTDPNRIAYVQEYLLDKKRAWKVVLHDIETDEELLQIEDAFGVQFSKNGKLLATLSTDGKKLRIHNAQTGETVAQTPGLRSKVVWFDFAPDGKLLASLDESGLVKVWDVEKKKLRYDLPRQRTAIKVAAWSPDGKTLATMTAHSEPCGPYENELAFWDADTGEARHGIDFLTKKHPVGDSRGAIYWSIQDVDQLSYTPDGLEIVIRWRSYFIFVNLKTEAIRLLHRHGQEAGSTTSFALSPDGKLLARIREKENKTFITVESYEEFRKLALSVKDFEELEAKLNKEREKK